MTGGAKTGGGSPGAAPGSQRGAGDAAAASAARTAIDTILQSSTVELFHSQGVAVAPLRPVALGNQQRFYDWVGVIHFEAANLSGVLTVSTPMAVWSSREGSADQRQDAESLADWHRELANQLIGRVKNRLLKFQLVLRPRLPSALSGAALELHRKRSAAEVLYRFRALRGDVLVVVDAPLERAILAYTGDLQVAREGDVIQF
jgi:hypothetical protein